jgi:hypothetical protein
MPTIPNTTLLGIQNNMNSLFNNPMVGVAVVVLACILLFLPTFIAHFRRIQAFRSVSALNALTLLPTVCFLPWVLSSPGFFWPTFAIWIAATTWALAGAPRDEAEEQRRATASARGPDATVNALAEKGKQANLHQAATAGVFLVVGVIVGCVFFGEWPEAILLGALGALLGALISGLILMVVGLRRKP